MRSATPRASKIEVEVEYAAGTCAFSYATTDAASTLKCCKRDAKGTGDSGHAGAGGKDWRKISSLSSPGAGTEVELSIPGNVAFQSVSFRSFSEMAYRIIPREERK